MIASIYAASEEVVMTSAATVIATFNFAIHWLSALKTLPQQ